MDLMNEIERPFEIDEETEEVRLCGKTLMLSPMEKQILICCLRHPGTPLSAKQIAEELSGRFGHVEPGTVQVHIHDLRIRLEANPGQPKWFVNVRGKGYIAINEFPEKK